MTDLSFRSVAELAALVKGRQVSPVEVVRHYLDRIESQGERLGAYIAVLPDAAMAQARAVESAVTAGEPVGALGGVPIGLKDIIDVAGVNTTAGSRVLAGNIATSNSVLTERLKAAGAIMLGKLNLSEFAIGGTIEHPYGTPRNPWNTEMSASGSSSGSAIAVAADLCAAALGSDTGGSVRSPASYCGVVGIRPTYGRVPRHGVVPMSWSLDTVGPMTRTVEDCALMLTVIAGHDPRDPTSASQPVPDYRSELDLGVNGVRIGLPVEMFGSEALDPEVLAAVERAVRVLQSLGAVSAEVSLPTSPHGGAAFIATGDVDAAAYHAGWLREKGDLYDWSTRVRLESASLTPATAYVKGQRVRSLIRREMMNALAEIDVIAYPTTPSTAPRVEDDTGRPGGAYAYAYGDRTKDYGNRHFLSPPALAGLPALSVPCGFSEAGLPVGLQLIGRPFAEATLLRVAHALEQATEHHRARPDL